MQYNFESLNSTVVPDDIQILKKHYGKKTFNYYQKILVFVVMYILLSSSWLVISGIWSKAWGQVAIVLAVVGALLFSAVKIYSIAQRQVWTRYVRLSRFASANGMTFNPLSPSPPYSGMIFSIGHSRYAYDQLVSINSRPFEMGNYRYVVGSGKNRHTVDYGYIMVQLERNLPHMVLDSKGNDVKLFGVGMSSLPTVFNKDQRLSLEGDFDNYFSLYAPVEYKRDALYVFTPDLMALFIDETNAFDAEIVDNKLYIYTNKPFVLQDQKTLGRILQIIDTVGKKTITQTDYYADERVGSRAGDIVAEPGQRLKGHTSRIVIILVLVYVAFQIVPPLIRFVMQLISL